MVKIVYRGDARHAPLRPAMSRSASPGWVSSLLASFPVDPFQYLFYQLFVGDVWVSASYPVDADSGDCICHVYGKDDFFFR